MVKCHLPLHHLPASAGDVRDVVWSLGQEDPLEPTPVSLLGESHGQRRLAVFVSIRSQRIGHNLSDLGCTQDLFNYASRNEIIWKVCLPKSIFYFISLHLTNSSNTVSIKSSDQRSSSKGEVAKGFPSVPHPLLGWEEWPGCNLSWGPSESGTHMDGSFLRVQHIWKARPFMTIAFTITHTKDFRSQIVFQSIKILPLCGLRFLPRREKRVHVWFLCAIRIQLVFVE